jgi:hypothetical protein
MGEKRNVYNVLVGGPEGRRPFQRPAHEWEDNTEVNFEDVGWESVDWMCLAQGGDQWQVLVNTLMSL